MNCSSAQEPITEFLSFEQAIWENNIAVHEFIASYYIPNVFKYIMPRFH